jgi:preprotein translocase subunit SecY
MVVQKIKQIWSTRDIRNDILFVLLIFVIFRFLAHIPVPGVDVSGLQSYVNSNQILGLLNILTGGGLENFSVVMLGVGPYITSSIIFQLLGMIVPKFEEMQKEGEQGRQKINQWTRLATIPFAILQSYGTIVFLQRSGGGASGGTLLGVLSAGQMFTIILSVTVGTIFLMWLGELISERRVGNGISLMIFAGIVAGLPRVLLQMVSTYDQSQFINIILFAIIAIVTVAGVVFITEGQRNVPVTYSKFARGNTLSGGVKSHLPIRVNQAGVIPIIFAISIVLFPPLVAQFFVRSTVNAVASTADFIIQLFNNQAFYGIFYFLLVFGFTYFYTAVIFKPDQISENLQKQGGFIPGIRPGSETSHYLSLVSNRILLAGALFLGLIAVMPLMLQNFTGTNLVIGGTSLLIVVSVVIETVKQINSQLVMRDYEKF